MLDRIMLGFVSAMMILLHTDVLAASINNRVFGLTSPDIALDFGANLFAAGTPITNQFAASGVTFGSEYYYFTSGSTPTPTTAGGYLGKGTSNNIQSGSVMFLDPVSAAAFSWRTLTGTTTLTAWLNGSLVETFTAPSANFNSPTSGRFYGFENVTFDELSIFITAPNTNFTLDNLQFTNASVVPLPAAAWLFVSALGVFGYLGKRKVTA